MAFLTLHEMLPLAFEYAGHRKAVVAVFVGMAVMSTRLVSYVRVNCFLRYVIDIIFLVHWFILKTLTFAFILNFILCCEDTPSQCYSRALGFTWIGDTYFIYSFALASVKDHL